MKVHGRSFDSRYPYTVRPAYRRDPAPGLAFDPLCVIAWCVLMPFGTVVAILACIKLAKVVLSLLYPVG